MADLEAILAGLDAIVDALDGARAFPMGTLAIEPGQGVAIIFEPAANYAQPVAFGGVEDVRLNAKVLTKRSSERAARVRLNAILEPLRDALTTKSGSAWDFTDPEAPTNFGEYNVGSGDQVTSYWGFTLPLLVAVS